MYSTIKLSFAVAVLAISIAQPLKLVAQSSDQPITSKELVSLLFQAFR